MNAVVVTNMKVSVVLNPGSGTLRGIDLNELEQTLKEALNSNGLQLISWHANDEPVTDALERALSHGPDCLMIVGGDGSVSAAARVAWANKKVLAILPGGTMNLYSRTLGLPMNITDCAAAYRQTRIVDVDVATADDQLFLHQFTTGLHARAVRLRNTMTYGSRISKIMASIRAFARVVFRPPRILVELKADRNILGTRTVSALSITNNVFGSGHIPYADIPDGGVLGVYFTDPIKFYAAVRLVIDTIMGATENNPNMHDIDAQEVTLKFLRKRGRNTGMLDGEIFPLKKSLHLQIHPKSLKVLLPVVGTENT